ncbi:MAG: hypothetical protein R3B67_06860 [Phycisphaerales bacterium]
MGTQGTIQDTLTSAGLLIARSMVGVVGIYHGGQKLFGLFGGGGSRRRWRRWAGWGCRCRR